MSDSDIFDTLIVTRILNIIRFSKKLADFVPEFTDNVRKIYRLRYISKDGIIIYANSTSALLVKILLGGQERGAVTKYWHDFITKVVLNSNKSEEIDIICDHQVCHDLNVSTHTDMIPSIVVLEVIEIGDSFSSHLCQWVVFANISFEKRSMRGK